MSMPISREFCYTDQQGKDIYLFTLRHESGTEARITNFGAIITSFKVKTKNGELTDIVLGFDKVEDYMQPAYLEQYPWFGAAIGRYANRIEGAKFSMDGKVYKVSDNRNGNILHGGFSGFDKKSWDVTDSGNDPCPFLECTFISPDGDEGFPGNLVTTIRYELRENELRYQFVARTDQPTPVNLTHHSYFNLNGGQGTIHDHELRIPASEILEQLPDLVATGGKIGIDHTPYDFRKFKNIGEGLKEVPEFDQSFIVDASNHPLVAELRSPSSGLLLQVLSTEATVHFYSGKWTPQVIGKSNISYGPFSGLCLETHNYLNAINIPHFPNTILRPDDTYRQETIYKVIV